MIVLGLTGSTASGKSFALQVFKRLGAEIHEADEAVHKIFISNMKIKSLVLKRFSQARYANNEIDRKKIGTIVYHDPNQLQWLEQLVHPHVRNDQENFKKICTRQRRKILVWEVPLLFETGVEKFCSRSIAASAPRFLRWKRAKNRSGMNWKKWQAMERRQYSDFKKRSAADFRIDSGLGKGSTTRQIKKILYRCRVKKFSK